MDGEDDLLAWLDRRLSRPGKSSPIGDDAAILAPGGPWAVTTDTQVAGTHFVPDLDPAVIARRLLAVNLSDLAAMGAWPRHAFLVISAPADFDHRRFFNAFLAACEPHGLRLSGGDLSRQDNLTLVLTLLGEPAPPETPGERTRHHPPRHRWLERSGARPGHQIWVGGTLGESAVGCELVRRGARPTPGASAAGSRSITWPADLEPSPELTECARRAVWRHLEPRPQLELGAWLANHSHEGACMDISDGLARDLHRLCRASDVGAELETMALAPDFRALCGYLGLGARELALGGGEDYVLLFTLPAGEAPPLDFGARPIGRIVEVPGDPRERLVLIEEGDRRPLAATGWDHLVEPSPGP